MHQSRNEQSGGKAHGFTSERQHRAMFAARAMNACSNLSI
jgi:hypothetical protein